MRKLLGLVVVLGVVCSSGNLALAGRPLSTDDVGTVAPGHLQVELGAEYLEQSNDDHEAAVTPCLTTGVIWDRLDFAVEVPYLWLRPDSGSNEDGFSDLYTRLKLRFLDEAPNFPGLAVTLGVKTETGDSARGLGTGETDFVGNFIAQKGFDRLPIFVNAGYNFRGDPAEEEEYDMVNLSLAGEFACTEKLAIVGEVAGEILTEDVSEDNPCEVLVGATYEIPWGTVLDAGVAAGLTDGSPDWRIVAGLTHEF